MAIHPKGDRNERVVDTDELHDQEAIYVSRAATPSRNQAASCQ